MSPKQKSYLIFDETCSFCTSTAYWVGAHYVVEIVSGQKAPKFKGITKESLTTDVHLINEFTFSHGKSLFVYKGADAVAKVISTKHRWIWSLYSFKPLNAIFKGIYFIVKKSRRYIG